MLSKRLRQQVVCFLLTIQYLCLKFRYILYNNLLFEQYTWRYKIQKYSYDISIILNYDYFVEQIDIMVTLFLRKRAVNLYKIWLSINHIMARQGEEK